MRLTIEETVERLQPLDLDGMAIMMDPPEQIPAHLVIRLCERKPLNGTRRLNGRHSKFYSRAPLAQERGGYFRLTEFGKQVAAVLRARATSADVGREP